MQIKIQLPRKVRYKMFVVLGLLSVILLPIAFTLEMETDWFVGTGELTGERISKLPLIDFDHKSYYVGHIFKGTYFQAHQFCRYHGMELLSIASKEENYFLQENMVKMGITSERFWTSGSRLPDGERWVWMTTGNLFNFTNWFSGEPNNAQDWDEQCVEAIMHKKTLQWNDVNCTRLLHLICEISWSKDCFKVLQKINATQLRKVDEHNRRLDLRIWYNQQLANASLA